MASKNVLILHSFWSYFRGLWFPLSRIFICESWQVNEFSTDLQDSGP